MDVTRTKQDIFKPQETRDNPFDVTLLVEDAKEFKAHRKVLSEASSFFEKLLNSSMVESKEGVVRLEMLTEAGLGAVLEFIYTGGIQILAEDNVRDLIEMADYLFISPLKTIAGKFLAATLNTSNCISTYRFAERCHCEELVSDAANFIHANFINVAKTEEFLKMSSDEVNNWISSDEIDVSSEEDVFKIILSWIDHDKSERKKYFADLFRQVRLVYVSRDYLFNDIVANDLVNDHECCLELVKDAMKAIDSKNSGNISLPSPRKSLKTPVVCIEVRDQLLGYVPSTNTWYKLGETSLFPLRWTQMVSCHGKLYTLLIANAINPVSKISRYDSLFDKWSEVLYNGKRDVQQIFVIDNNEDGIYALETDNETSCPDECVSLHSRSGPEVASKCFPCGKKHLSYITKYKPESNSWEDISSVDFGLRKRICIIAKDNFIYFIGGVAKGTVSLKVSADVDRYDLSRRKWDKLANLKEARYHSSGTSAHGKIFIYGGRNCHGTVLKAVENCEVYNERTNEWHLIAKPGMIERSRIMCVDDKVYAVGSASYWSNRGRNGNIVGYDPEKDAWNVITKMPALAKWYRPFPVNSCSMRVFKGAILHWTKLPAEVTQN